MADTSVSPPSSNDPAEAARTDVVAASHTSPIESDESIGKTLKRKSDRQEQKKGEDAPWGQRIKTARLRHRLLVDHHAALVVLAI